MTFPARPVHRGGITVAVLNTNDPRVYWPEGRRYTHRDGCGPTVKMEHIRKNVGAEMLLQSMYDNPPDWLSPYTKRRYKWRWISADMSRIRSAP